MTTVPNLNVAMSVTPDDLIMIVDSPDGTPVSQRARIGDVVALVNQSLAGTAWTGPWVPSHAYTAGQLATHSGNTYIALSNHTSGDDLTVHFADDFTAGYWQFLVVQGGQGDTGANNPGPPGDDGIPNVWDSSPWSASKTYIRGTTVRYAVDNGVYVSITDANTVPTDTSQWRQIAEGHGGRGPSPFNPPEPWVTGTAYTDGSSGPADLVFFDGAPYACIVSHTSGTFATDLTANKWQILALAGTGAIHSVTGTAPITVNSSAPSSPLVAVTHDVASGVAMLDSSTKQFARTLVGRVGRTTMKTAKDHPSAFSPSGSSPITGATFADRYVLAEITVPADPLSTGGDAYNQKVSLEGAITPNWNLPTSAVFDSNTGTVGYAGMATVFWVRNGTTRIEPSTVSTLPVLRNSGPTGVTVVVNAIDVGDPTTSDGIPAGTDVTYQLCTYKGDAGDADLFYNISQNDGRPAGNGGTTEDFGYHDAIFATAILT